MRDREKKIRIVMAVTNDLVTDRRVMRHVGTLRVEGFEVVCIGRNELGVRRKKGWMFYAEYNLRLWWRLLRTKVDIVWANDTDTLLGCYMASWMKRCRLVMDAHELFPEVPELIGRQRVKRLWERLERWLMPKCDVLLTVCQSIADYYKERYGVEMTVVRNVPLMNGVQRSAGECKGVQGTKVLLYQGCVNKGRGVNWAIDALEWLEDCRLVVAGGGDLLDEMKAYAADKPWADRIEFLGRLTPEKLEEVTASSDVGLVMLEDMGLSYHYALPNRIGDFIAAGVPMVVSDLPEMARVVREYGVGEVIGECKECEGVRGSARTNAELLAEAVKNVLAREWSESDFAAARRDMNWEREKVNLLKVVEKIKEKE